MKLPATLFALSLLAACGSSGGNEGAAANKAAGGDQTAMPGPAPAPENGVAAAPAAPVPGGGGQLQPGQWEITALIRSLDMPGTPPQQQAMVRQRMGRPMTNRVCMTEEQARDFASFANRQESRGCTVGERVYAGGVIRLSVTCQSPSGRPGTMRMTTQGSYTPTTLNLTMNQEATGVGTGAGSMRMSATMTGRRLGPCPAGGARPVPPRIPGSPQAPPVMMVPPPSPAR